MVYFGTDQDEALARYSAYLEELKNSARAAPDETVDERNPNKELANVFLTHSEERSRNR